MKAKVRDLKKGMKLRQSVYKDGRVLMEKGQILTGKYIEKLMEFSIEEVSIEEENQIKEITEIRKEEKKIKEEFQEVYKKTISKAKGIFEKALNEELDVETIGNVVDETVKNLEKNPDIFLTLLEMREEANYLYEHSLKSSIIALSIGKKVGYDKEQLKLLGKAALLHDIGMFKVDKEILNKEEKLTEEELQEIRNHTRIGAKLLESQEKEVQMAALYHHERIDGGGYPKGLKESEIPELVKIITISDLYAALVSDRVYREAKDAKDVIKYLMSVANKQVDTDIVKRLLENMSLFSMGSYIRLNNGLRAKVVKATENPFRPIVDVEDNGELIRINLNEKENALMYVMRLIV